MNETQAAIVGQLRENTGRSILDSGDYYGRGYERWNRISDDAAESRQTVTVYGDYFTINAVEWLAQRAEYDADMTRVFRLWATLDDPDANDPWLVTMERFVARLTELGYDDSDLHGQSVNTYNHDSALDETFQYIVFSYGSYGDSYILLQTHNGCDMRGGYSAPNVYRLYDMEGPHVLFDESIELWHDMPDREPLPGFEPETQHAYSWRNGEWSDYDGNYLGTPWNPEGVPVIRAWDESGNPIPEEDAPFSGGDYAFQCPKCGVRMEAFAQGF